MPAYRVRVSSCPPRTSPRTLQFGAPKKGGRGHCSGPCSALPLTNFVVLCFQFGIHLKLSDQNLIGITERTVLSINMYFAPQRCLREDCLREHYVTFLPRASQYIGHRSKRTAILRWAALSKLHLHPDLIFKGNCGLMRSRCVLFCFLIL